MTRGWHGVIGLDLFITKKSSTIGVFRHMTGKFNTIPNYTAELIKRSEMTTRSFSHMVIWVSSISTLKLRDQRWEMCVWLVYWTGRQQHGYQSTGNQSRWCMVTQIKIGKNWLHRYSLGTKRKSKWIWNYFTCLVDHINFLDFLVVALRLMLPSAQKGRVIYTICIL